MADPRKGKLSQSVTVLWSDGSNFNGYLLIGIVPPTAGGTDYTSLVSGDSYPVQRLPVFTLVPIKEGKYHDTTAIFFTADMEPPTSTYKAWLYDATRRQIAGPSAPFTVSTDPFTPPSFTATVPASGGADPVPDSGWTT